MRILQDFNSDIYDVDSYNNQIFVSDRSQNSILVLNEKYQVEKVISGIGSAPNRLFRPGYIDVSSDGVIYVQDGGNERIQSFALDDSHLGGFTTTPYVGFAAGTGNEVYLGQPESGQLISVYSQDGKHLRSFGKLKTFSEVYGQGYSHKDELYRNAINRVRLSVDKEGDILVSFMLAPIIQKYTRRGELIFERRLEGPEVEHLVRMLLSNSPESYLTISTDGFPERVIALEAISLSTGKIYVTLTDGSVYVADQDGYKLHVLRPQADQHFTPEMTGISPAEELLVIGLSPRYCYLLSQRREH